MDEIERFENWLKTTITEKRKSESTAYNYARAIKRVEMHYKEVSGCYLDLFDTPIERAKEIEQMYLQKGKFSDFGNSGKGTVRNALSALIRYRINPVNEQSLENFQEEEIDVFPNFHYEKDLQETILFQINELFPTYKIYGDDSEEGVKYRIGGKEIDILLESSDGKSLLIIELKAGKASEKVYGQIAMYYGLIKKRFPEKEIFGLIIAQEISEELIFAGSLSDTISFMNYSLKVNLSSVEC